MTNFWICIAIFALGNVTGVIIGVKLMGDQIHIEIKKVKNKRTSGQTSTVIPIEIKSSKKPPKKTRAERKQERIDKRNKK